MGDKQHKRSKTYLDMFMRKAHTPQKRSKGADTDEKHLNRGIKTIGCYAKKYCETSDQKNVGPRLFLQAKST